MTNAPRFGSWPTRPSARKSFRASRTGARLIPISAARRVSTSRSPDFILPARISWRISAAASVARDGCAAIACIIGSILSTECTVNRPHCLTKKVLESDSLPQIRKYSKAAELLALHMGGKEGGDGGPIDAREASDHQGDGAAVRARRQAGARADARRALRPRRLQQKLRGPAAARQGPR